MCVCVYNRSSLGLLYGVINQKTKLTRMKMKSVVDLHSCVFAEGPTMLPQNSVGFCGVSVKEKDGISSELTKRAHEM